VRFALGWLLSTIVLGLGVGSAGAQPAADAPASQIGVTPQSDASLEAWQLRLTRELHVSACRVVPLTVDTTPSRALSIAVPVWDVIYTLDLVPHSVRAETYQVIEHRADGSYVQVKPAPVNTLRGFVREVADSVVAGGVLDDGLYAEIILSDQQRYWIQPARSVDTQAPVGLHVVYRNGDCTDFSAVCTTADEPTTQTGSTPFTVRGGTQRWVALMAVDAEFQYFRQSGSSSRAQSMINLVVNIMNVQYEREVDIRHAIGTIIVRTFQNYNPSDPVNNMRTQFQNWWNANHGSISRDLAVQFDGNGNGGQTAPGHAICNLSTAYCGCGMDWANLSYRTDVVAHEVGHCWSACHCACTTPPYTMDPFINYANRFEGAPASTPATDGGCGMHGTSIAQIVAHRNSRSCLDVVSVGSVVPNDTCANAMPIPCDTNDPAYVCTWGFNNRGATTDGPAGCGNANADIWYRYTAPCNGTVTFSTCGSAMDTILAAYSPTAACPPLDTDRIACSDDSNCGGAFSTFSNITFNTVRASTYLIRVSGYGGFQGAGILAMQQSGCPAPPNDFCTNAMPVGQAVDIAFTNVGATTGQELDANQGRPVDSWLESPCVNGVGDDLQLANDVWFRYVAPCSGTSRFSTCGSTFDTKIAVYDHCPTGDNQRLSCNDDSCGLQSNVDVFLNAGVAYLVRVGGYHGAVGAGTLHIDSFQCPPPLNDNCDNPYGIPDDFPVTGTTYQGSVDGTATRGQAGGPDVWYTYVPGCTGVATIDTCGLALPVDTVISVHTGCPGTTFNQIAVDDDGCGYPASRLTFYVVRNTAYHVRVAAYSSTTAGQFTIRAHCTPAPPPNDSCANAIDVSSCAYQNLYTLVSATNDGSSSCGSSATNPDVWFTYTAPFAGRLIAATCGTNDMPQADQGIDTVMSMHTGCPGNTTNEIACIDDSYDPDCYQVGIVRDSYISYQIAAGETVKIRVSKYNTTPVGPVFFYVSLIPSNATCAGAITIADGSVTPFCTDNAGTELTVFPYQDEDLWYRYVAPCDGDVTVDLCGSHTNASYSVFQDTGVCPPPSYFEWEYPNYWPDCEGFFSRGTFPAQAGRTYLIEVGTVGIGGPGMVRVACSPNSGACCYGTFCHVTTAAFCAQAGATFRGVGEPCKFAGNPVTCCPANFNQQGGLTVQDIFDFLATYFANGPTADFNASGGLSVQDIFDFLAAYFTGCS
jgi:hypothetical protein